MHYHPDMHVDPMTDAEITLREETRAWFTELFIQYLNGELHTLDVIRNTDKFDTSAANFQRLLGRIEKSLMRGGSPLMKSVEDEAAWNAGLLAMAVTPRNIA